MPQVESRIQKLAAVTWFHGSRGGVSLVTVKMRPGPRIHNGVPCYVPVRHVGPRFLSPPEVGPAGCGLAVL